MSLQCTADDVRKDGCAAKVFQTGDRRNAPVQAVIIWTLLYRLGVDGIRRQSILGVDLDPVVGKMVEGGPGLGHKGIRRIGLVVGVGDGHDLVAQVPFRGCEAAVGRVRARQAEGRAVRDRRERAGRATVCAREPARIM